MVSYFLELILNLDDSAELTTSTQSISSSDTIEIITAAEELHD
jgi:hypothetical protein